jgi:hypothetical protein
VSGTIKKAEEEAIRRAREVARRARIEGGKAFEEMGGLEGIVGLVDDEDDDDDDGDSGSEGRSEDESLEDG